MIDLREKTGVRNANDSTVWGGSFIEFIANKTNTNKYLRLLPIMCAKNQRKKTNKTIPERKIKMFIRVSV